MADVRETGDELYQLPPEAFVAARDEAAAAAREAGDRDTATAIGKLRRPTVSGWLVNLLALRRPDRLEELFTLADELRSAQRSLSGPQIRELTTRRRQVLDGLAATMRELAAEAGRPAEPGPLEEATQTLAAALADESAAETVRAGRVQRGIRYAGFGEEISEDAMWAAPAPKPAARPKKAAPPKQAAPPTPASEKAPAKKAEAPAKEAREAPAKQAEAPAKEDPRVTALRAEVQGAEEAVEQAEAAERAANDRLARLNEEFAALEERLEEARRGARDAARDRRTAERDAVAARRRLAAHRPGT